jgi:hypothetical protein
LGFLTAQNIKIALEKQSSWLRMPCYSYPAGKDMQPLTTPVR